MKATGACGETSLAARTARKSQVIARGSAHRGSGRTIVTALLAAALVAGGLLVVADRQRLTSEMAGLRTDLAAMTSARQSADLEKESLARELDAFRQNSANWAAEIEKDYAALKLTEVPKLNRLLDKRDAEVSELQVRIKAANEEAQRASADYLARLAKLTGALDSEKMVSAAARAEATRIAAAGKALEAQVTALEGSLATRTAERDAALKTAEALRAEIVGAEADLARLSAELDVLRARADAKPPATGQTPEAAPAQP